MNTEAAPAATDDYTTEFEARVEAELARLFDIPRIKSKAVDLADAVECAGKMGDAMRLVATMLDRTREIWEECHTRADDLFPGPEDVVSAHGPYHYFRFDGRIFVDRDPEVLEKLMSRKAQIERLLDFRRAVDDAEDWTAFADIEL